MVYGELFQSISEMIRHLCEQEPVLPKHTLFKVLYFILAKFKNHTLFILFFSQIL